MIELKSAYEIERMRHAGRIVSELLDYLSDIVRPGVTTKALDQKTQDFIRRRGAKPAFLGYRGYPASVCISINEEVVHGIPGAREICEGDLVSIDVGVIMDGFYGDAARTIPVGRVEADAARLVATTRRSLDVAVGEARAGRRLSDISHAIQECAEKEGFGVVRDFVGHGIGRAMHEDPPIPNFGPPNRGPRLVAGMVLAIEPMVTLGRHEVVVKEDGWTAVTRDRSPSAHFEHTVAITDKGTEILTASARKV